MSEVVVFLGPTLPLQRAREELEAIYLPPVKQGDVIAAVRTHAPGSIVLIDGVFAQELAVWHKEILWAMERGVRVYGASSMGALRAAECAAFGMVGVGAIFEAYRSGELTDDDEVALPHGTAEQGWRKLGEAMVNLRATLHAAAEAGVLPRAVAQELTASLKARHFSERSWPAALHWLSARGHQAEEAALRAFVQAHPVDLKAQDAVLALRRVREEAAATPAAPTPRGAFVQTGGFDTLLQRDRPVEIEGVSLTLGELHAWAAVNEPGFQELHFAAMNRALGVALAQLLELRPSAEEITREEERFFAQRGRVDPEQRRQWLRQNQVEPEELRQLMAERAACRRLHGWLLEAWFTQRSTRVVLDELRLQERFEEVAAAAAAERALVELAPTLGVEEEPPDERWQVLREEHHRWTGIDLPDPAQVVEGAGLMDEAELRRALAHARTARRALIRAGERGAPST